LRFTVAVFGAACVLGALSTAAPPPLRPTPEQIGRWIKQLGEDDFVSREEATRRLWQAGDAAEGALRRAARSDDPEVSRRAQEILAKFKWGLYPDTPREVAEVVTAYQEAADVSQKAEAARRLLRAGPYGIKALRRIGSAEANDDVRDAVFSRLRQDLPSLVADDHQDAVASVVEAGLYSRSMGPGYFVAWWMTHGRPAESVAMLESLVAGPHGRRAAEALVYLHRARGDLSAARRAADKARSRELAEGLLYEAGDWKALAALPELVNVENPLERLAFRAAYHRLAGNAREADEELAALRKAVGTEHDPDEAGFQAAKAFFLNDRPAEALEMAARSGRWTVRFEVLVAQLRYREALALVDAAAGAGSKELPALELLQARTLYMLGERDKAQAIFARRADQIREGLNTADAEALLETEYRLGLKDQAFAHCARALALNRPDGPPRVQIRSFLAKVFPDDQDTAVVWWTILRRKHAAEAPQKLLGRVRDLLAGKTPAADVRALIDDAPHLAEGLEESLRGPALADVAQAAGLDELARKCLEKSSSATGLLRLGDVLAEQGRWQEAARRYQQAWEKDRGQPLPLFLAGQAWARAGRRHEADRLTARAHALPLGDEAVRTSFLQELARRGHADAVRREAELLRVVSAPESFSFGAAVRYLAIDSATRKDFLGAARGYDQAMLRCLHSWTNFVQPAAYVGVPALVHRLRAAGLLATNDFDAARREIALARSLTPGNIDLAIDLIPELQRHKLHSDADRLYEETLASCEQVCKEYPRCAWMHNSAAWLSACCRRDLDAALTHARKAVELAPDTASYLDTLAEVHFQCGDKEKAVALQRRVLALDPKKLYYRKQLQRLQASDPKAPRPPEDED
jgi:tetratricopeptide (TPR) repeat protein